MIRIPKPVIPFGPTHMTEDEATVYYLREVVRKLGDGNGGSSAVGGSNVTNTVVQILRDVSRAIRTGTVIDHDELDALPAGTVVLSSAGSIVCRWDGDRARGVLFGIHGTVRWLDVALPATVLHRPEAGS